MTAETVGVVIEYKAKIVEAEKAYNKINSQLVSVERQSNKTMGALSGMGRGFKTALASLGVGLGVGAGFAFLKHIAQDMGDINDAANRLGISTDAFQRMSQAAKEAGISQDTLSMSLFKTSKLVGDAKLNIGDTRDSLEYLKLTFKDFEGLSTDKSLSLILDRLSMINDQALRDSISMQLLGKSAKDLSNLMGGEFKNRLAELNKSGFGVTAKTISAWDTLGDKIDAATASLKNYTAEALLVLANDAGDLADKISGGGKQSTRVVTGISYDPNNSPYSTKIDPMSLMAKLIGKDVGGRGLSNATTNLDTHIVTKNNAKIMADVLKLTTDSLSSLGQQVVQTYGAVNKFREALLAAGEAESQQYIQEAIKPTNYWGETLQAPTEAMKQEFSKLLSDVFRGKGSISGLGDYTASLGSYDNVDTTGMNRAIKELENYLKGQQDLKNELKSVVTQPARVDLRIEVSATDGLWAQAMSSPYFSSAIDAAVNNSYSSTARMFGRR